MEMVKKGKKNDVVTDETTAEGGDVIIGEDVVTDETTAEGGRCDHW